ncbi:alpha/beta fold hydrolase [Paenibacillus larvae]|uniref:AB hydrolase-1 domain-containing protein n=5 Tax=Paenibacillus larvae TaxID=1464 RepID=A0A1U9YLB1_9BACL|nr:alpha/beta hydrolase [Paenibacillus larvae]AHD06749.1 putative aminopeptidase YbaC [Paenibacillus larvae subsp. larvae DSM 25430]AQZ46210.1 hypothetical protein B5S25_05815 [Paenibacillus larvae subsp. pulvifaciens]ARF67547.1 hypothetical protein B7C51_06505 [Paenibacillus larvae subsp. pulvifaciens]AVF21095.1 putative aminopeptidase YbaC [Paenibacillus larvae subsp. larvae]AVF27880.1 putative aminopeptidase YbaC [Paenibacillus larvae subsp. larvae]
MFQQKMPLYSKNRQSGIAAVERWNVGGINQWVMMRGMDIKKPLLLFLHGGPGIAQIGFARSFQKELEEHFVVVNWDQRGSGLSFSKQISPASMNVNQFVQDTLEVTTKLLERFQRPKLYLVGHSWGSILGMLAIKQKPEYFYAYYGIGQISDMLQNEEFCYQYSLNEAQKRGWQKAVKELGSLGPRPFTDQKSLNIQRKWLGRLGGIYHEVNVPALMLKGMLASKEYGWMDLIRYTAGTFFSTKTMWPEIAKINVAGKVPEVNVPVIINAGKYDYSTPSELSRHYYQTLRAPDKGWFWFERSGHSPHFEEPERFREVVLSTYRTYSQY